MFRELFRSLLSANMVVTGILLTLAAIALFYGSIYLFNHTNLGKKLGFLVTGAGIRIRDIASLAADITAGVFDMAILAVPAASAQTVANLLVEAGVKSMLNFAPARIEVPRGIAVRQVDLSHELQVLSYYG